MNKSALPPWFFFCIGTQLNENPPDGSTCKMLLCLDGSTVLSGDIVGILVSWALGDRGSEHKGWESRLVSSTCLIYCPAAFEVGQAEFTPLWFLVISPPRLQPRWGPSPSTTGYRKYLSVVAPGHRHWATADVHASEHEAPLLTHDDLYVHWQNFKDHNADCTIEDGLKYVCSMRIAWSCGTVVF